MFVFATTAAIFALYQFFYYSSECSRYASIFAPCFSGHELIFLSLPIIWYIGLRWIFARVLQESRKEGKVDRFGLFLVVVLGTLILVAINSFLGGFLGYELPFASMLLTVPISYGGAYFLVEFFTKRSIKNR